MSSAKHSNETRWLEQINRSKFCEVTLLNLGILRNDVNRSLKP